jgi:hypothetical protein
MVMSTTIPQTASDLQALLDAYIDCALWSSTDDDGTPLDSDYDETDLAPETLAQMREDCTAFLADNAADCGTHGITDARWSWQEQCGHDFWLTRNRHGAGFWDRGTGDVGQRLADAARIYGACDLYVGDNGLIYSA